MTSAGSSADALSGPVGVCVDRPLLSLDRPFTYDLPAELGAGVGSLVQVPFHGRATRGWVLGSTEDLPKRMLEVKNVVSPIRFFDDRRLELFRWVSERYIAPFAAVVARAVPPRVASEETGWDQQGVVARSPGDDARQGSVFAAYRGGEQALEAIARGTGAFVARPAPDDEQTLAVDAVAACVAGGRRAIVVVPEAVPVPATASSLLDAFGDRAALFLGGGKRSRYRTWLEIASGRYDVVIGTRPAVFAPLDDLGLIYLARESHPAHREDRAPYYHGRDVALARSRLEGAVCVLAAACPSAEATALGSPTVSPASRRWPPDRGGTAGPRRACAEARQGTRLDSPRVRLLTAPRLRRRPGLPRRAASRRPARRAAGCSAPPRGRSRAWFAGRRDAAGPAGERRSASGAAARSTWRSGPAEPLPSRFGGSAKTSPPACPVRTRS